MLELTLPKLPESSKNTTEDYKSLNEDESTSSLS